MNTTRIQRLAATGDAEAQAILDRDAARHGALNTLDRLVDVVLAAIEAEDEDMLAPVFEALDLDDWQRTTLAALLTVDDIQAWPLGDIDEDDDEEDAEAARTETREQIAEIVAPWFRGEVFSQAAVDELAEEFEDEGWDARWYSIGQAMPYWGLKSPGGELFVAVWWDDSLGTEFSRWCWSRTIVGADQPEDAEALDDLGKLRALLSGDS